MAYTSDRGSRSSSTKEEKTTSATRPSDASGYSKTSLGSTTPAKSKTTTTSSGGRSPSYTRQEYLNNHEVTTAKQTTNSDGSVSYNVTGSVGKNKTAAPVAGKTYGSYTDENKRNEFINLFNQYYDSSDSLFKSYDDRSNRLAAGEFLDDAQSFYNDIYMNRGSVKGALEDMADWLYNNSESFNRDDYNYYKDAIRSERTQLDSIYDSFGQQAKYFSSFADGNQYAAAYAQQNGSIKQFNADAQKAADEAKKNADAARKELDQAKKDGRLWSTIRPDSFAVDYQKRIAELEQKVADAEAVEADATARVSYGKQYATIESNDIWYQNAVENGTSAADIYVNTAGTIDTLSRQRQEAQAQLSELQSERASQSTRVGAWWETADTTAIDNEISTTKQRIAEINKLISTQQSRLNYADLQLQSNATGVAEGKQRTMMADAAFANQNNVWTDEQRAGLASLGDSIAAEEFRNVQDWQHEARSTDYMRPTDQWTQGEKDAFYALMNTNEEAAKNYAIQRNRSYAEASRNEQTASAREWGAGEDASVLGKIGRGAVALAANVAATPVHLVSWVDKMAETLQQGGNYVGRDNAWISDRASARVEGRAEQLNEDYGTIAGKGFGDLYQLGSSIAQSLALGNIVGEAGTLIAFFGQAADQSYDEAISRGATGEQAALYSMLSGFAEVAGEKLSLDNLLDTDKRVLNSVWKSILTQAGIEGSEEAMTDVFNLFNDYLALRLSGGQTEIQTKIDELMAQGMSYDEASKQVWKEVASDVAWDVIGGAISGGVSSGIQFGVSNFVPYESDELTAGNITAEAREQVNRAADKGDITKLANVTKRAENRLDKGKSISVATARSLVKQTNRASMVDATEQQVKNRTELEAKDARSLANAVVAKVRGEQLTKNQMKLVENNKDISDTLTSELKDADKDWTMNIGVRGKDATKYGSKDKANWDAAVKKANDAMTVDVDGKTGTIQNVVRDTDGNVTWYKVKTADGVETVSAEAASKTKEQQATVIALTERQYGIEKVNTIEYGKQNPIQYYDQFDTFAEVYGNTADNKSFEDAWKSWTESEFGKSSILTEEQARAAWNAGRASKETMESGLKYRGTGKVTFEEVTDGDQVYEKPSESEIEEFKNSDRYKYLAAVAKAVGVDIVFFKTDATGINGQYLNGKVYLAINASPTTTSIVEGYVMATAAHELTHYIRQASPENYLRLKDFVSKHLIDKGRLGNGKTFGDLISEKQFLYRRTGVDLSVADAIEEVVADACGMALRDNTLLFEMKKTEAGLWQQVKSWLGKHLGRIKTAFNNVKAELTETQEMEDVFNELQQLWTEGVVAASRAETSVSDEQQGKLSIKEIVGADGNTYGMGVYLDSNLLDNLTDDERIDMVKLYIEDELGGKVLTAFDEYGVSHDITIADKRRFTNKSGKRAKANSDLTHHTDVNIKQQAIANSEELILAASFVKQEDASHPHDWLDDNGNNKWDLWKVHIQEKNNTIWTASLRIANTTNGEKVLYDIGPIKKVEGGGTAPTQSTNNNILQGKKSVKQDVTQSMTMAQAKRMLDASFNALGIRKFGDYSTAEQWVREEGADSIALEIESDYDLYMRYISKLQGIVDDDYTVEDIIQAYIDGTLVGQEKAKAARLDVSQPTDFNDTRFYAPHNFSGDVSSLWQTATQRLTNANREAVNEARRQLLFFAHSGMSLDGYGITASELNKKLKQWSNYTSKAVEVSNRINEGVPVANQWTGIQNCSILNKMSVTTDDITQMVKEITGESNEHQRNYIGRALLALDTHIDWTGISFEFAKGYADPARKTVRGLFNKSDRKITIGAMSGSSTVAHEMGHALDNIWFREIFGNDKYSDYLSETIIKAERIEDPELQQFYKNYQIFIKSLADTADISSSYTQKNTETFARFVAKFVEWADVQAGNSFYAESNYFRDNFNASQYIEFARLLQEKAMIDAKSAERKEKKQQGKYAIKNDNGLYDPRTVTEQDVLDLIYNATYGLYDKETLIPVRINTPGVLIRSAYQDSNGKVTISNLPMVMYVDHVRQITEESEGRDYGDNKRPHEIIPEDLVEIIKKMNNPADVVIQNNKKYAEIIHHKTTNGKNIIAVVSVGDNAEGYDINPEYLNGFSGGSYNLVVTIYPADSMEQYKTKYEPRSILEKNGDSQRSSDSTVSSLLNESPFFVDTVPQGKKSVKTRDNAYESYNRRAVVSEDTLEQWLKDYAASNPNYAQAYIAYMTPKQFLNLTTEGVVERIHIAEQAAEMTVEEAEARDREEPIFLRVDAEGGLVTGHEGRHRMSALYASGIETVPVLLLDSSNKYSKTSLEELPLRGQFNDYHLETISDVEPLSRGNIDTVREKFSTLSSRETMGEKYGGKHTVKFSIKQDNAYNSQRSAQEQKAQQQSLDRLTRQNEILQQRVEYWKGQTKRSRSTVRSHREVKSFTNKLLKNYDSNYDAAELEALVQKTADMFAQNSFDAFDDGTMFDEIQKVAADIVDNAEVVIDRDTSRLRDNIIDYLKHTEIALSDGDRAEIKSRFGSMQDFRKHGKNKAFRFNGNGRGIDSVYAEMNAMFGEVFPAEITNTADELEYISDVINNLNEVRGNPFEGYEEEATRTIEMEIHDFIFDGNGAIEKTFADKQSEKLQEKRTKNSELRAELRDQMAKSNKELRELRTEQRKRIEDIKKQALQDRRAAVEKERKAKWEKVSEVRRKYQTMIADSADRRGRTAMRNKIKNLYAAMSNELLKPKQGRYVPKELIRTVAQVLELVNADSGRSQKVADKINTLNTQYRNLADSNEIVYDATIADMIQNLAAMAEGKTIYQMTRAELQYLYNTMKAIQHTVTTAVKMVGYETEKDAFQIAKGLMQETAATNPMQNELLNKWLNASMRPESFFKRLGGYRDGNWMMMYDMLDKAQLYQSQLQMEGAAIFQDLMNDTENFNKMTDHKNLVDIGLKDASGDTVPVTMDIAIKIYMDTLNEDNARHFMYAGYTVPDMKTYYKGKVSDAYAKGRKEVKGYGPALSDLQHELRQAETEEEKIQIQDQIDALNEEAANWVATLRQNIWDKMGEYEHAWVQAAQKFFNEFSQNTLNKTTLEVYGYEKATVENYVPIHTDSAYRTATFESISKDMSLENSGFMKERIEGAKNPMYAEGIVDVVSGQIDKVAKYAAMMPAIRNFTKVYGKSMAGYTDSVQAELLKKFGTGATKYIENLMADLTGSRYVDGGMLGEYADKLRGNLAASALTLNPRVALGQTASYPTAAAVVGWSALGKALKDVKENPMLKNNRETLEEIAKYSPLMWLRMQGYFDESVKDMRSSKTIQNKVSKKLNFLTNWIETMDGLTVGQLWFAAQYWVEDNTDLKRGTEEFMQKSAEMFNKIVEETQPDYTALQRPDILRNPNAVVKQMTMFMTQRLQNVNILFDAVGTYNQTLKDNRAGKATDDQLASAKKSLTLAVSSQLAAAATITAFKLVADALMYSMKGYRDDDDELTKESIMSTVLVNSMESLASNFLWGAEIYDLATSLINKETYYGVSLAGVDTFVDMTTAFVNAANDPTKTKLWKLVKNTCQLLGIPLTNMEKMYNAVRYRIDDVRNGEGWNSYASEIKWTDEQRGRKLYDALVRGDKDAAQKQYEYFGNKADANEQVVKYIKQLYADGELSEEDAALALQNYADVSVYDSQLTISKLKCEKDTGIKYDDIKEQYQEGKISKEKAAEYRSTYGDIDLEDAEATVQQWTCEKETGYEYENIRSYIESGDITEQEAVDLRVKYGGHEEDAAIKTVRKWMCEIETGIPYDKIEDYYAEGLLDKQTLTKYYMEYGLYDEDKAKRVADKREFIGTDTSLEDISLSAADGYWGYCEDLDVDKKLYLDTYQYCWDVRADKNANGKSISGTAAKKKCQYIDTLPLSSAQKTAVAKACNISDNMLKKHAAWYKK